MTCLCKLKAKRSDRSYFINPLQVRYVMESVTTQSTVVVFDNEQQLSVEGTVDEVAMQLESSLDGD